MNYTPFLRLGTFQSVTVDILEKVDLAFEYRFHDQEEGGTSTNLPIIHGSHDPHCFLVKYIKRMNDHQS